MEDTCRLITERESMANQRTDTSKSQLEEAWVLLGLLWVRCSKGRNLDYSAQPAGSLTGRTSEWYSWFKPLPHKLAGILSSRKLIWSWSLFCSLACLRLALSFYFLFWQRGAKWIWSISGTSWSSFELSTFLLKALLAGWSVSVSEETVIPYPFCGKDSM